MPDRPKRLLSVDKATAAGAATYTRFTLSFYDLLVFGLENRLVYNRLTSLTQALYNRHITANHLEIGVGTGYYLDRCTFPSPEPAITLLDLNRDCLEATAHRLRRYRPRQVQRNVLAPLGLGDARFDSIGLNYVLHCLPGSMLEKSCVFGNIRGVLNEGGVVFGTTVLGRHVRHSLTERFLLGLYNRMGILNNWEDDIESLEEILSSAFDRYSAQIQGRCIAVFEAWAAH